ncbi:hypothetical protein EDD18DRAFT_1106328 [Armillaria luteobubalina]|uniref:Uncharacterized protein n=1 Tax=Armillaria luteobubalina TaxID=153913 RepID=A0AA39Q3T6_9AGAR|nr:hypothetical protein EDD18DRAFT_1106328 [Armillaria luteobubalina]
MSTVGRAFVNPLAHLLRRRRNPTKIDDDFIFLGHYATLWKTNPDSEATASSFSDQASLMLASTTMRECGLSLTNTATPNYSEPERVPPTERPSFCRLWIHLAQRNLIDVRSSDSGYYTRGINKCSSGSELPWLKTSATYMKVRFIHTCLIMVLFTVNLGPPIYDIRCTLDSGSHRFRHTRKIELHETLEITKAFALMWDSVLIFIAHSFIDLAHLITGRTIDLQSAIIRLSSMTTSHWAPAISDFFCKRESSVNALHGRSVIREEVFYVLLKAQMTLSGFHEVHREWRMSCVALNWDGSLWNWFKMVLPVEASKLPLHLLADLEAAAPSLQAC